MTEERSKKPSAEHSYIGKPMPEYIRGFAGKTITASMLNSASFCPVQTWRSYGPRAVPQPPIPQAVRGTAVHHVMQELQAWRRAWEPAAPALVREWITEAVTKYDQDPKEITRCVVALARATQGCNPEFVEKSLTYPLGNGWQLAGTLDWTTTESVPRIGDWKTTERFDTWTEQKAQVSAQSTAYTWLLERHLDNGLGPIMTYYVVDVPTGRVKQIPVQVMLQQQLAMLREAVALSELLSSETPPETRHPDRCAQWCPVWNQGGCGRIE